MRTPTREQILEAIAAAHQTTCAVPGCERDATTKGLCPAHYQRSKTGGVRPEQPLRIAQYPPGALCVDCQERAPRVRWLCYRCYRRRRERL
jgi:hypothetical protein